MSKNAWVASFFIAPIVLLQSFYPNRFTIDVDQFYSLNVDGITSQSPQVIFLPLALRLSLRGNASRICVLGCSDDISDTRTLSSPRDGPTTSHFLLIYDPLSTIRPCLKPTYSILTGRLNGLMHFYQENSASSFIYRLNHFCFALLAISLSRRCL